MSKTKTNRRSKNRRTHKKVETANRLLERLSKRVSNEVNEQYKFLIKLRDSLNDDSLRETALYQEIRQTLSKFVHSDCLHYFVVSCILFKQSDSPKLKSTVGGNSRTTTFELFMQSIMFLLCIVMCVSLYKEVLHLSDQVDMLMNGKGMPTTIFGEAYNINKNAINIDNNRQIMALNNIGLQLNTNNRQLALVNGMDQKYNSYSKSSVQSMTEDYSRMISNLPLNNPNFSNNLNQELTIQFKKIATELKGIKVFESSDNKSSTMYDMMLTMLKGKGAFLIHKLQSRIDNELDKILINANLEIRQLIRENYDMLMMKVENLKQQKSTYQKLLDSLNFAFDPTGQLSKDVEGVLELSEQVREDLILDVNNYMSRELRSLKTQLKMKIRMLLNSGNRLLKSTYYTAFLLASTSAYFYNIHKYLLYVARDENRRRAIE